MSQTRAHSGDTKHYQAKCRGVAKRFGDRLIGNTYDENMALGSCQPSRGESKVAGRAIQD